MTVFLGYLRSYVNMGQVALVCEGGCQCSGKEVNAHHQHQSSQTVLASLVVGPHCAPNASHLDPHTPSSLASW